MGFNSEFKGLNKNFILTMEGEAFFEISIPTYIITNVTFHDTEIRIVNDIYNVNKKAQLDATICRHLFTAKSLYMFRASQHP